MTTLRSIIEKVNEKNLTKDQLEQYHSDIVKVYALFHEEIAEIRKVKALYFMDNRYSATAAGTAPPKRSDKETERMWQVTEKGQREIELSHWLKATEKLLGSLKNRLYSVY